MCRWYGCASFVQQWPGFVSGVEVGEKETFLALIVLSLAPGPR